MSADIEKFKQKQAQQEKDFVEIFGKLQILKDQLVKHKSAIQSLLNTIKTKNNCTVCFPLITKRMINGAHPQSSL